MGRGEGPKRGHMYTGLHGKRGGAKEGSHVHTGLHKGSRGRKLFWCAWVIDILNNCNFVITLNDGISTNSG